VIASFAGDYSQLQQWVVMAGQILAHQIKGIPLVALMVAGRKFHPHLVVMMGLGRFVAEAGPIDFVHHSIHEGQAHSDSQFVRHVLINTSGWY